MLLIFNEFIFPLASSPPIYLGDLTCKRPRKAPTRHLHAVNGLREERRQCRHLGRTMVIMDLRFRRVQFRRLSWSFRNHMDNEESCVGFSFTTDFTHISKRGFIFKKKPIVKRSLIVAHSTYFPWFENRMCNVFAHSRTDLCQ